MPFRFIGFVVFLVWVAMGLQLGFEEYTRQRKEGADTTSAVIRGVIVGMLKPIIILVTALGTFIADFMSNGGG